MEEDKERNNFGQEDGFAGGFSAAHVTLPTSAGRGLHRFHQLTIEVYITTTILQFYMRDEVFLEFGYQ